MQTIDTINGASMNLDPLTGNLTFDVVDVDGSPTSGIIVDDFAGILTVNDGTIQGTNGSAVMLIKADQVVLNNMNLSVADNNDGAAPAAVSASGRYRTVEFMGCGKGGVQILANSRRKKRTTFAKKERRHTYASNA